MSDPSDSPEKQSTGADIRRGEQTSDTDGRRLSRAVGC